jgi:hypothetical protein
MKSALLLLSIISCAPALAALPAAPLKIDGIAVGPKIYDSTNDFGNTSKGQMIIIGPTCQWKTESDDFGNTESQVTTLDPRECRYLRPQGNCMPHRLVLNSSEDYGNTSSDTLVRDTHCRCQLELETSDFGNTSRTVYSLPHEDCQ